MWKLPLHYPRRRLRFSARLLPAAIPHMLVFLPKIWWLVALFCRWASLHGAMVAENSPPEFTQMLHGQQTGSNKAFR